VAGFDFSGGREMKDKSRRNGDPNGQDSARSRSGKTPTTLNPAVAQFEVEYETLFSGFF
jgi:hypothetical protein